MPTDPPKRQGPKGLALSMPGGKSTYPPAPNLNETPAVIDFSVHGFITNKNNDQLPVGFIFTAAYVVFITVKIVSIIIP